MAILTTVTAEDRAFLHSRKLDWAQLRQQYLRHLDTADKRRYLDIYLKYVGWYVLDYNCQDCLIEMLMRLMRFYDALVAKDVPPADVPPADVPPADVPPADVPPADVPPADVPPADVQKNTRGKKA